MKIAELGPVTRYNCVACRRRCCCIPARICVTVSAPHEMQVHEIVLTDPDEDGYDQSMVAVVHIHEPCGWHTAELRFQLTVSDGVKEAAVEGSAFIVNNLDCAVSGV
eukprot:NODE_11613_length_461_cov_0.736527_g11590_i0.p1 GENE.NODE_11613_length_461_cov_0.736527_g11590_i0~~NODE_11613_length_461_cov_0.736527_g11590_i0.p1  ORF type:complete len:107 (+),score=18.30 NODE_11613_length_461_cov_0.736527_g11590_i0:119-439(+)